MPPMLHRNRVWCVTPADSAESLASMLTETTWCSCAGFALGGYLFLNDSTGPDGAQEYAIVKRDGGHGRPVQIESITFGWCTEAQALEHIRAIVAGRYDRSDFSHEVALTIETPEQHGRCSHCA
jgi:hypothetical protein